MKWQKIGTVLLIIALLLTWLNETGFAYVALILAGLLDIYLWWKNKKTISQWIQDLWPKRKDIPVLLVLSAVTFHSFFKEFGWIVGLKACLPLLIFGLLLHLFANKD